MAAVVRPMVPRQASASDGRLTMREIVILLVTLSVVATATLLLVLSTTSSVAALS
jgi:hypothetical protein